MIGRLAAPLRVFAASAMILGCYGATALSAAEGVSVENPWVTWTPPGVKVQAAYMTVVNRRNEAQSIVAAESPDYERIELHSSSIENGIARMQHIDRLAIPVNGSVSFEPGGLHLMLIGPKRTNAVDDRIRILLRLESGESIEVVAVVRRRDSGTHNDHNH